MAKNAQKKAPKPHFFQKITEITQSPTKNTIKTHKKPSKTHKNTQKTTEKSKKKRTWTRI
jgi:hypothetical protein